jgi:hypothetical protein
MEPTTAAAGAGWPGARNPQGAALQARLCSTGRNRQNQIDAMPTQKFRVPGLNPADQERVIHSVMIVEGVLYAIASPADGCLEVEFEDDCVTIEELARHIEGLGYPASPAG